MTTAQIGPSMKSHSLPALAVDLLAKAHQTSSGRAARTIHGGREHDLRQTAIALVEGRSLGEHESPGEATLHVLSGRTRLTAGQVTWEGSAGDCLTNPLCRWGSHGPRDNRDTTSTTRG